MWVGRSEQEEGCFLLSSPADTSIFKRAALLAQPLIQDRSSSEMQMQAQHLGFWND